MQVSGRVGFSGLRMPSENGGNPTRHRGLTLLRLGLRGVFGRRASIAAGAVYTRRMKRLLLAVVAACVSRSRRGRRPGAAERPRLARSVGAAPDRPAAGVGDHDRRPGRRHRDDRHRREPDSRARRRARSRLGLRRQRRGRAGHARARHAGRQRHRRARQQPARDGGSLLALPDHARARDRRRHGQPERIAAGIVWAVEHGARIINVSLTSCRRAEPGRREARSATRSTAASLVVASAGNNGNEVPQYPAAYPGVLAVGATDDSDKLYFWSTRGPWVALTAPGCHMSSTQPRRRDDVRHLVHAGRRRRASPGCCCRGTRA